MNGCQSLQSGCDFDPGLLLKIAMVKRSLPVTLLWVYLGAAVATTTRTLSYAALGDSYAAGDGAGSSRLLPHFDVTCGRFSGAYPVQIAKSSDLLIPNGDFKNLACGGASSLSILYSQVPKIGESDIVTITVGGNEVDFFAVLNACVHQWWPSGSCEKEMAKARALVQSSAFLTNFNKMVARTKGVAKPGARLLVTGYAAFFNDETAQCNNVSFSRRNFRNVLTNELRKSFNQMVRMINDVIQAAAEAHEATYVDVDRFFEGHRFCEEGVVEPSDRNETWFFNIAFSDGKSGFDRGPNSNPQNILPEPVKDFFDLTKTFHPTSLGHQAIAKAIVSLVRSRSG